MMTINDEFKIKVRDALLALREKYDGSDGAFSIKNKINYSYFSQIKNGKLDVGMSDGKWIALARELGVGTHDRKWNVARTAVFNQIEEEITFCQEHSSAMIFVDDCGIGKSYTAKYLSRTRHNCFYIDASQSKTKIQFVKALAKTLGIDNTGRSAALKEDIKYYLKVVEKPIIILDEAGDLDYNVLLDIKEFWNATEGFCGWYMMGADGLKANFEKGIGNRKVGYREIFSRFNSNYSRAVPIGKVESKAFYRKLIGEVLEVNAPDDIDKAALINKCMTKDGEDNIGGLRRLESLLHLNA